MNQDDRIWRERELYPGCAFIAAGTSEWREAHKLPDPGDLTHHRAPQERGVAIALAFESTKDESNDPLVRAAYRDMARQSNAMFDYATNVLGITVEVGPENIEPYATAQAQAQDLLTNHHITTESGLGGNHTLLSRDEYDRFRSVHDIFGHAGIGGGFDRHGEYQAFLEHCSMYSGLGRWAMASEYRGVNCSLWAGHDIGAGKAILLPQELVFREE